MVGNGSSSDIRGSRLSVSKIIRTLSQSLHLTSPSSSIMNLLTYKDGKFVILDDKVDNLLNHGTNQEVIECINLLKAEIDQLPPSDRIHIWDLVYKNVDLKIMNNVRNATLQLMAKLIKLDGLSTELLLQFYCDIIEIVDLSHFDKDLKWILLCLDELLKSDNGVELFQYYKEYPLSQFLFSLFNQISKYKQEELNVLIIVLVSDTLRYSPNIFTKEQIDQIVDFVITNGIKTNDELMLKSFIMFLNELLSMEYDVSDNLYTIVSILGCANGLDDYELDDKCSDIFSKLISNFGVEKAGEIISILLKNLGDIEKDNHKHRVGERSKVGCIRYLSKTLKYFGKFDALGKTITEYYNHHLNFMFDIFILAAKENGHSVKLEILKFIAELFENPYTISKYHKVLFDKPIFWDALRQLNWSEETVMSYSYQEILLEMFNKLQTFESNKFVTEKIVEYFRSNYSILTSYNISMILKYYSDNNLCVCGMSNWRDNCKEIVERYYFTSPTEVFKVVKNSMMSCIHLKIDEPSLKFYTDLLCYSCVLNLSFPFIDDEILLDVLDVLDIVDYHSFKIIIFSYCKTGIKNEEEINSVFLMKLLVLYAINNAGSQKSTDERINFILNEIIELTKFSSENKGDKFRRIFTLGITVLTSLRSDNENHGLVYLKKLRYESDEEFNRLMRNDYTENRIKNNVKTKKILSLYQYTLKESNEWIYYFSTIDKMQLQFLNGLFENERELVENIFEMLIEQLQVDFTFKFKIPSEIEKSNIELLIVNALHGFFEYKSEKTLIRLNELIRYLIIDLKFDDSNMNPLMQFLNCCIYETPELVSNYISIMIDIMNKIEKDEKYRMLILETLMTIYYNREEYSLTNQDFNSIFNILLEIINSNYNCSTDHLTRFHYFLFLMSYELSNWYLPIIPQDNNSLSNYVTGELNDSIVNGIINKFPISQISIDLIDVESNDVKFRDFLDEITSDVPMRPLHKLINWSFHEKSLTLEKLSNFKSFFKLIWINEADESSLKLRGKCILVNKLQDNSKYYCINTIGIKGVDINNLIISTHHVTKLVTTIVFICGTHLIMDLNN